MQKMFMYLKYSDSQFYDPSSFCQAFKDSDGKPIQVSQKKDVFEYTQELFSQLENELKGSKFR